MCPFSHVRNIRGKYSKTILTTDCRNDNPTEYHIFEITVLASWLVLE